VKKNLLNIGIFTLLIFLAGGTSVRAHDEERVLSNRDKSIRIAIDNTTLHAGGFGNALLRTSVLQQHLNLSHYMDVGSDFIGWDEMNEKLEEIFEAAEENGGTLEPVVNIELTETLTHDEEYHLRSLNETVTFQLLDLPFKSVRTIHLEAILHPTTPPTNPDWCPFCPKPDIIPSFQ